MRKNKKRIKWKNLTIAILLLIVIILFIITGIDSILDKHNKNSKEEKTSTKEINPEKNEKQTNAIVEEAPKNNLEFINLKDGEYLTEKGFTLKIKDKIAYIDNHIIVNKTYSLPANYIPNNSNESVTTERCNNCINKEVMEAFKLMQSDAKVLGLNIYIASGYRGYTYQEKIYNNYVSISGQQIADTYSARPGHSEHQTGTCFDLNSIDDSFANTQEGKWVNENAYIYGFIIRYPKGKESITGYQYESWHLRYVGKNLAKDLYQNGNWTTLEEYYGISSNYE